MKTIAIAAAASLAVGGATGYLIGTSGNTEVETKEVVVENSRSSRGSLSRGEEGRMGSATSRMNEVLSRPGQTDRLQGMLDLYDQMKPEDFAAEAERLRNLPGAERFIGAFLLYSKWGEEDPIAAMEYSNKLGMMGMMVRPIVLQGWAGADPQGAVGYFDSNKSEFAMMSRFGGSSPAGSIAGEWARQDPDAAMAWAKTLEGRERSDANSSIFRNLAVTDPTRAASLAAGLETSEERAAANSEIARSWAGKDWDSSQEWIKSLPLDEQAAAQSDAIRGLAQTDPMRASQEVLSLQAGESRERAITEVAENMAMQDPKQAASWVMENGSQESQTEAIGDIMRSWAATDQQAARSFIDQQPQGDLRDRATSSYVTTSNEAPVDRLKLAETISDERTRERAVARTAGQWMREEPEAAKEWIQGSDSLSDGMKERLQNGGGRGWGGFGRGRR